MIAMKMNYRVRPSVKTFNKSPKNYTAPVSFVAGGIQQAGKSKNKEDNNDKEDEEKTQEFQAKHYSDFR